MTLLERLAVLLVSICLTVGLIALLTGFFASHDQGSLSTTVVTGHQRSPRPLRLPVPKPARP